MTLNLSPEHLALKYKIKFEEASDDLDNYRFAALFHPYRFAALFPPPIEGSVHGTVMHSSVSSINIIEMFFAPLEWFLGEE